MSSNPEKVRIVFPPTISQFLRSDAFVRVIRGPVGSGKSSGCCFEIWRRAGEQAPNKRGIRPTRWAVIRNCFSADTEILTENGWKFFPDLDGERVAQLSDDGYLEFVEPVRYYEGDYVGPMVGFQNEGVDFLVTPDHKLNVSLRNARRKEWSDYRFRKAHECYGKQNLRVKRDAKWRGKTEHSVALFRWLGLWFAEGHAGFYGGRYHCGMVQKDTEIAEQIYQEADVPFTRNAREEMTYLRVSVTPGTRRLIRSLLPLGKATTKWVPDWIKSAPQEHLNAFLEGYEIGDGKHNSSGVLELCTSSVQLADDLQEVALRAGWAANVHQRTRAGEKYAINGNCGVTSADGYTVTLTRKTEPKLVAGGYAERYRGWYQQHYVGKVYCIEVPSHRVYVRRKGKAHWSSQSYRELRDTTIKTWLHWFPEGRFGDFNFSNMTHHIKVGDIDCEVLFRSLDKPGDVGKILSLELTGAWVNEAREIPMGLIDPLTDRIGRFPAPSDVRATWEGLILDTNAMDEDHPLARAERGMDRKREEYVGQPEGWEFFIQPGGIVEVEDEVFEPNPEAENTENLPPGYYARRMANKTIEHIRVYYANQFGFSLDGKPVFPEYNDRTHCRECEPENKRPIRRGWDFGLTPACTFSQLTTKGRWIVFDELTAERAGADRFSDEVLSHCARQYPGFAFEDFGDPAGVAKSETDERSCFDILQAKGIDIEPGEQAPAIRQESIRKPLNSMVDGEPQFTLHPRCKMLRKGFLGGYHYRRLQTSEERYTDKPEKNEYSHPHDGLQYDASRLFAGGLKSKPKKSNVNWSKQVSNL